MKSNEFNKKYKINDDLAQKFCFEKKKDTQASSIAGKPKKMWMEILKRLLSNPIVVISLIVFITILLLSIIIPSPAVRYYTPNKLISNSTYIYGLPPMYHPNITLVLNPDDSKLGFLYKVKDLVINAPKNQLEGYQYIYTQYMQFANNIDIQFNSVANAFTVTYNAYDLNKAFVANSIIESYLKVNGEDAPLTVEWMQQNVVPRLPELHTILGTTSEGFDVWTTTWYATYKAIKIALLVAFFQAIIGIAIGAYLGFNAGKMVDTIAMRVISILTSPPTLIWLLILVSIFGANEKALIFALIIVGWPTFVGITRMFIITVKNEEYISAAKSIGASTKRQIFVHALPAIIGKIANSFVKTIPGIILWIASLAFLGFFKESNDTNLGQLLITASSSVGSNLWVLILPTLILLFLSLSLNFIALGIHDALDPKVISKGKRK